DWPDGPPSMAERLAQMTRAGLDTAQYTLPVNDLADAQARRQHWFTQPLPFATDGVVIRQSQRPSATDWRAETPYWDIACIFPPQEARAGVRDVEVTVGRSGRITPVQQLDRAALDDRRIRRGSAGSLSRWRELDVRPGDRVSIKLSGQ